CSFADPLHGVDAPQCGSQSAPCQSVKAALRNCSIWCNVVMLPGVFQGAANCDLKNDDVERYSVYGFAGVDASSVQWSCSSLFERKLFNVEIDLVFDSITFVNTSVVLVSPNVDIGGLGFANCTFLNSAVNLEVQIAVDVDNCTFDHRQAPNFGLTY